MEVAKVEQMIAKPQVIAEIAKSLKNGTCELKIEKGKVVIVCIERTIKYSN